MDWKVLVGFQVLLLILLSTSASSDDGEKRIVCYYTNWSVYRPGTAKFSPQNINPYLCTHLIYAFGGFTKDNTLKPFDKYQDVDKGGYAKFTGLKTYNKNLKTLLAIGGWNEGSNRFSPMVADPQRRRQFVKSAVKFLRQNHFDGLDLDWEYPAFREGGKPRDKNNYANLVQELREEFERESSKTGRPRLLLTMAVPAGTEYIDKGYDVPKLDEYLDFINLLSYDYHSAYEPAVNHHSPLYPLEEDNEYNYDNELTIDYTIKHLIKSGASSEKIVVGIPTYGRSYTLFNDDANTLGSPADGPGIEGDATREKGYLAYYEICESITKDDWNVEKPNPKAMGPYAYKNNQWVGYDDEEIVRAKAKYVNEKKLGGIMFWSIDNDDFRGKCHGRPYPLIEAAKEALFEENEKLELDVRPNAISTKKRNRVSESSKSNSLSNNRKSTGASNRRNTISRSFTGKRSSTPSKSRNRSNSKTISEHKPEDESIDENVENNENAESTKSSHKSTRPRLLTNKNRFRTRLNINERDNLRKQTTDSTSTQKILSKKLTTPEPPTTPDPGSDFKCEDEGFFPHPRDCKKYFWCLDSGPSGLGIVANQFTCPSGLVFNKLADSCDYPRNVICPKNKPKSTTTTPRTLTVKEKPELSEEEEEKEEDDDEEYEDEEEGVRLSDDKSVEEEKPKKVITTSAKPLLYKTIHRSRPTTTTTKTTTTSSTPVPVFNSANLEDEISDEEQDPRVIKELINLIKKAGGIEHLEKQLALQEKTSIDGSNEGNEQVTPATISKSLYERVLNQQSGKNNLFGLPASRLVSSRKTDEFGEDEDEEQIEEKLINSKSNSKLKFVNGPGRSQFEGLDEVPEVKNLRRSNKPKYVTITRQSSSTISTKTDDELDEDNAEEEEEVEEEDNEDVASSEEKLISNVSEEKNLPAHRSTPGYVNIRRTRPTSTTESSRADNDIKELDTVTKEEKQSVRRTSLRPTEIIQKEATEENTTPKTKYISINRFRSTTITPQKEIEQTTIESTSEKPAITTESFNDGHVVKEKTITVSGESGRISITPFTTAAPSTARTLLDHMSSTLNSTSPYTEEKFISTHYATKQVTEMTTALNPNTIEDSATESLLNIASTESSIRETIAAVSQPRPFGFPRRTRPTIALSTISDTTRSSLTGIESTPRSKVLDEPILQHSVFKNITAHKTTSNFMTEIPKKISILNNSLHSKPENDAQNISFIKKSLPMNPLNQNDMIRIVKVPVRLVDDPGDDFFLLQIPKNKLNVSRVSSILKIEVLKTDERILNDVNMLRNVEDNNILNGSLMIEKLNLPTRYNTEITAQSVLNISTSKLHVKHDNNTSKNDVFLNNNEKNLFLKNNENSTIDFTFKFENLNSLNINKTDSSSPSSKENSTTNESDTLIKKLDTKKNESAIYNLQKVFIKHVRPFFNANSMTTNPALLQSSKNSTAKKRIHRQRVLIYRSSAKDQPTNKSSQRRWIMKKVVRKRLRPTRLKLTDDPKTNATVSTDDVIDSFIEVNSSRNPGLSLFQQPGDMSLPEGAYTTISSATLSPETRILGIMADQSGIPQNLELILAEPPATISSTTDSGRAAITTSNFRRKISTTISPRTTEETSSSTSSSKVISSERRRLGQKYDSDRIVTPNSYQIRARPYKPAVTDYDYYEDEEERFVGKPNGKLFITNRGIIKCLDQGSFPHPSSCKKFISCAKMVNGNVIGTEYTCPRKLSFDPIGGICNWSAGLGCND